VIAKEACRHPAAGATWIARRRAIRTRPQINLRKKADTSLKKHTRRAHIDRKKADTLPKKYDCINTPKRYNGNTSGALPRRFVETALPLAKGAPVEKGSRPKRSLSPG
jgi:hypothetical protein